MCRCREEERQTEAGRHLGKVSDTWSAKFESVSDLWIRNPSKMDRTMANGLDPLSLPLKVLRSSP